MKLTVLTASIVILSAGYAFAGAGAPVPEGQQIRRPQVDPVRLSMIRPVRVHGRWLRLTVTRYRRIRPRPLS